jgi:hypothetical protein
VLEVYPPWGQLMHDPGLILMALAYRTVYAIVGSYLAARFAPYAPMRHAMALGFVGLVLSTAGAIATIPMNLGPAWYPIAIVLTALLCAWLGGVLYRVRACGRLPRYDEDEPRQVKGAPDFGSGRTGCRSMR